MFAKFLENNSLSNYKFNSNFVPTIEYRECWENFQNETCVKEAEQEINYSWPIIKATDYMEFLISGNRQIGEDIHYDRRNHLILFTLAELKENKGRFLPQIVNGIFTICEETFWGVAAHLPSRSYMEENLPKPDEEFVDLCAGETAEHLSMIYKTLYTPLSKFCPEILARIEHELEKRIKKPYLEHTDWRYLGYAKKPNNWNPWVLTNLLTAFLLTEKDEDRLIKALNKFFTEIQFYYAGLPEDGSCNEGTTYWDKSGAMLFEFVYQIKLATNGKIDLFDDEKLKRVAYYMKKAHVAADHFVNVADSSLLGKAISMILLYGFAKETKQDDLVNFSVAVYKERIEEVFPLSHKMRTMRRLIFRSQFLKEMENYSYTLPIHTNVEHIPNLQLATIRKDNLVLSAKGGTNDESHNHNDIGSFTFYHGNTPLLIDVGIGVYSRANFSSMRYKVIPWTMGKNHNIPVINNIEQVCGKEYYATSFTVNENEIAISLLNAYPTDAKLLGFNRKLSLIEKGMACADDFAFTSNGDNLIEEVLMTTLSIKQEKDCLILDDKYILQANGGKFSYEFIPFNDEKLTSSWKSVGVNRILITYKNTNNVFYTIKIKD